MQWQSIHIYIYPKCLKKAILRKDKKEDGKCTTNVYTKDTLYMYTQ